MVRKWLWLRGIDVRILDALVMEIKLFWFCFCSDYLFKLLLIGDSGVGKSCLLLRFAVRLKNSKPCLFIFCLICISNHFLLLQTSWICFANCSVVASSSWYDECFIFFPFFFEIFPTIFRILGFLVLLLLVL